MNERLMYLRKKAGFKSRDDFAKELGVKPGTYRSWEQEYVQLRASTICMLCDYFGVSADYLLGRDTPGEINTPEDAAFYETYSTLDAGHQEMLGEIAVDFQRSEAWSSTTVSDQSRGDVTVVGNGNVVGDNNTVTETGSFDGDQTVTINSYGG